MKIKSAPVLFLVGFPVVVILILIQETIFSFFPHIFPYAWTFIFVRLGDWLTTYLIFGGIALIVHLLLKRKFKREIITVFIPIISPFIVYGIVHYVNYVRA